MNTVVTRTSWHRARWSSADRSRGLRVLYGDRIRSRGLDVFGQVPCMAGESGSMPGRRMLPQ
jgi:hypothetical protein